MRKYLLALLLLWPALAFGSVANLYISNDATLSPNDANAGDSCVSGHPVTLTFFNTAGNWGAGASQIGSDSIVHLCGANTGTAGATGLTFQGSGTSGHPVTLLFESGASLKAPNWGTGGGSASGAISISGKSDIVIDGGATGNAGAGTFVANGVIQNTLDGTSGGTCPGGTCTTTADSTGIGLNNVTDITIRNLSILNMYTRTSLSDEIGHGYGIQKLGTGSTTTITNVVIKQMAALIWWNLPSGTDPSLTISNSEFANSSAGIVLGQGSGSNTGVITAFTLSGNHFHDFNTWNETTSYNFHHDGIHIYTYNTAMTGLNIYNNLFDGDIGSGTAWVYEEQYAASTGAINIFNNVVNSYATQSGNGAGGTRSFEIQGNSNTVKIYNNTIIGVVHSGTIMSGIYNNGSTATIDIRNNTIGGNLEALIEGSMIANTTNNNNYDFSGGSHIFVNSLGYNASNFAAWKTACSCDASSIDQAPNLNTNFTPQAGSPLILAAQNLTGNPSSLINSDKAGVARSGVTAWDIGALQSSTSGPSVSLNPTQLDFGNVVNGATSGAQTITLTNGGGSNLTMTSVTLTGTNAAQFTITANTCTGTIAAAGTCTTTVTFSPNAVASFSASVTYTTNAASSPDSAPLSGTGVAAGSTPTGTATTGVIY